MSETRAPQRHTGNLAPDGTSDAWWGGPSTRPAPAVKRRPARRPLRSRVLAAGVRVQARVRANARFRRSMTMLGGTLVVVLLTGSAVGVIMLNNVVMQRSAELGRLESERRELRTENALKSAEIAKLSAPPRIVKLARARLGMRPSPEMARFVYLDPANKPRREPAAAAPPLEHAGGMQAPTSSETYE